MDVQYLIRFVQAHESFRRPELEALASFEKVNLSILEYQETSPFCLVKIDTPSDVSTYDTAGQAELQATIDKKATSFVSRSILIKSMFEVWGVGTDYTSLHADIKVRSQHLWSRYEQTPFKFNFDIFSAKRSSSKQREIINTFSYLGFKGKIVMKNPEVEFTIMEEWEDECQPAWINSRPKSEKGRSNDDRAPKRLFFGRLIGNSRRALIEKHDLKKRPYISTTSMDAELALVTANLALARPGKLFLDPFVGTGGFMVAASELGALSLGSDIDGRSFRGKGTGTAKGVGANFQRYKLQNLFGDCITSDITNTPFRSAIISRSRRISRGRVNSGDEERWLDGIISDPPYGIREGLKVLGVRSNKIQQILESESISSTTTGSVDHLKKDSEDNANDTKTSDDITSTLKDLSMKTADLSQQTPQQQLQPHLIDGVPAYTLPDYIAPKKPYSFNAMLNDILNFAAATLVDGGRLAFWMPSANDIEEGDEIEQGQTPSVKGRSNLSVEDDNDNVNSDSIPKEPTNSIPLPQHAQLELKHVCIQNFNKWSRKLLVYERKPSSTATNININININNDITSGNQSGNGPSTSLSTTDPSRHSLENQTSTEAKGTSADDLNPFRKRYFQGFKTVGQEQQQ